jgi:hypothetical protein
MKNSSFNLHVNDPDALAKQLIQRAHNRDGLPEIAVGLGLLSIAGLIALQMQLEKGSAISKAISLILALWIPVICFILPWAVKWVRRKYLLALEGFVEMKPAARSRMAVTAGVAFVVAIAVAAFTAAHARFHSSSQWMIAGTGLLFALLLLVCGRARRYTIGGIVIGVAGILLAFCQLPLEAGFVIMYGFAGLMATISGTVVLLHFMGKLTGRDESNEC